MDCILNFVYDVWDEENNIPKPNRLKTYNHPDDIEGNTWRISTDPMKVFADVKINNRRMEDVEKYPEEVFSITCGTSIVIIIDFSLMIFYLLIWMLLKR